MSVMGSVMTQYQWWGLGVGLIGILSFVLGSLLTSGVFRALADRIRYGKLPYPGEQTFPSEGRFPGDDH